MAFLSAFNKRHDNDEKSCIGVCIRHTAKCLVLVTTSSLAMAERPREAWYFIVIRKNMQKIEFLGNPMGASGGNINALSESFNKKTPYSRDP